MMLRVLTLLRVLQLANCLPIVDPGLFVIMGVRSCRAGTGYCLLGLDCTLDEDFLPDDEGGHCDGLRSAFTPSAHFICCRYNSVNRTNSSETVPLSTPMSLGQDVTDNYLGLFSDYSNTDSEYYGASNLPNAESSEGSFVQIAAVPVKGGSNLQNENSAATETNIQTNADFWLLSSSSTFLYTADSSMTVTEMDYDISNRGSSDTVTYEQVLVTEGAGFSTQDDASQSTSYSTEMSTDSYATTENILINTDVSCLEDTGETANTKLGSGAQTTETSVTQLSSLIEDQRSSDYSAVKSSDGTGDIVHSNSNSNISLGNKPIDSRAETERMQLTVLTGQGIVKAYPSVVRAETEILVQDNKTRHRNVEVQINGVTTKKTVTQMTEYKTELSNSDDRLTTNDAMEMKSVSHRDTTTEVHPSVTVGEELHSEVDNVATALLQSVSEVTVTSLSPLDQSFGDTTTNMEVKSGEAPVKLYGDRKVLQDHDQNSFVNTNEHAGSQTEPSTLVSSTDLTSLLVLTVTDTPTSGTQNLEVSKDEIINVSSELMATDDKQLPSKDPSAVPESPAQYFLIQGTYKYNAGADSKILSFDLDSTDTLFQPSKTESKILKNTVKVPEKINELSVTVSTEGPLLEKITNMYHQTVTSSGTNSGNKTWSKPLHKGSNIIGIVPTLINEDRAASIMPKITEGSSLETKSTNNAEFTTESFESPGLGVHETTVPLQPDMPEIEGMSVKSDQFSAPETVTEHVRTLGTEQLNEITTSNAEMSEKQLETETTEGSNVSAATELAGGLQLRSRTEIERKTAVFLESDRNVEDITEFISASPTVINIEITGTSEGTTVVPAIFKTIETSSPAIRMQSFSPSTIEESSNSILSNSVVPAVGVTTQQSSQPSSLCDLKAFKKFQGTQCWLVQLIPYSSNSSICVGSYLDSNTIVTSANCVSRLFDVGVTRVTLLSAGGTVTPHTMIRDIIVHEEYRKKGVKFLLNDIGLLRLEPGSPLPPAACALCLPQSDQELMDRPCSQTSLGHVKSESDTKIGSPMVCSDGVLAGVASYHNPDPVYTPISDYVSWIQTNQKIQDYADNGWK